MTFFAAEFAFTFSWIDDIIAVHAALGRLEVW